ncbi:MAG TPA: hypothetical protein DIT67_05740 [Octadecabacter sp.]|nr:hypothetical protein [Octadecabacter sp.]
MRRLLIFILSVLLVFNTLIGIAAGVFDYSDHADIMRVGMIMAIFLFNAFLLLHWREKLRRKIPPRGWKRPKKPKREKKKKAPVPQPAPVSVLPEPEEPRPLAASARVQPVPLEPVAASSAMPDRLRQFVIRGQQAVHPEENATEPTLEAEDRGRFIPPEHAS